MSEVSENNRKMYFMTDKLEKVRQPGEMLLWMGRKDMDIAVKSKGDPKKCRTGFLLLAAAVGLLVCKIGGFFEISILLIIVMFLAGLVVIFLFSPKKRIEMAEYAVTNERIYMLVNEVFVYIKLSDVESVSYSGNNVYFVPTKQSMTASDANGSQLTVYSNAFTGKYKETCIRSIDDCVFYSIENAEMICHSINAAIEQKRHEEAMMSDYGRR